MIDLYFMSPPSPGWALRGRANFRSREAPPVDAAAARREWWALAEAIESLGGTVVVLPPPSDALSGMPYAAECGHVVQAAGGRPRFLLPRMASPHRRGEKEHWAVLAAEMGFEVVPIQRGVWEAQGDVARFRDVTLLFHGGRTDREGLDDAARCFPGEVMAIEIREPAFHGNMALLPLVAADRMLVCPDVLVGDGLARLEARFGRDCLAYVGEAEVRSYATNGLPVGDTVLAPSVVPERVVALVRSLGMNVRLLPMQELCEKAGGASRCLVSHARVDPDRIRILKDNRLSAFASLAGPEPSHASARR